MSSETLIQVEHAGKKFCRSLKRSLWYGMQDMASQLAGGSRDHNQLRDGEFWAVNDVSFELKRGECLGLIGRNGAGKTTLLRMLTGLIKPDRGRITMRGRISAMIALNAGFNPILTGRENIYVNGSVLGLTKKEIDRRIDGIIDFAEIAEAIDAPVQSYSSGMQVRLGFAVASVMDPDVLILDEVLAVGDAAFRVKCFNRMHEILENTAVIFVSHNMPQVARVSSRMMLLERGRVIADDTALGKVMAAYYASNGVETRSVLHGDLIDSVYLQDENGNRTSLLSQGKRFSVVVGLSRLPDDVTSDLRFLLTVSNEEENNVAQAVQEIEDRRPGGRPEYVLHFDAAPFNAGRFLVSCSLIAGKRGQILAQHRNVCPFQVESESTAYAPIIMDCATIERRQVSTAETLAPSDSSR